MARIGAGRTTAASAPVRGALRRCTLLQLLFQFLIDLFSDPQRTAASQADPEGTLAAAGFGDITGIDVAEALPLVVDALPADAAGSLTVVINELNIDTDIDTPDLVSPEQEPPRATQAPGSRFDDGASGSHSPGFASGAAALWTRSDPFQGSSPDGAVVVCAVLTVDGQVVPGSGNCVPLQ